MSPAADSFPKAWYFGVLSSSTWVGVCGAIAFTLAAIVATTLVLKQRADRQWIKDSGQLVSLAERNGSAVDAIVVVENILEQQQNSNNRQMRLIAVYRKDGTLVTGNLTSLPPMAGPQLGWHEVGVNRPKVFGQTFALGASLTGFAGVEQWRWYKVGADALPFMLAVSALLLGMSVWLMAMERSRRDTRLAALTSTLAAAEAGQVTARVLLDEAAHNAPDLDLLATRMNAALERIEQRSNLVRDWSAQAAHELRGNLARIITLTRSGRDSSTEIEAELLDLLDIFDALLDLVEIGGDANRVPVPVRVHDLMEDVARLYAAAAEECELDLQVIGLEAAVVGERWLLVRALADLVDNALQHTPPGGRIELTARRCPVSGAIQLIVRDTGLGPQGQNLKDLMSRPRTASDDTGRRLGLRIVQAIAMRHGGKLEIGDAEPGFEATITLPS